ncbi:hypothetical protein GFY24_31490 [Nocardia sp. SYP-A9097]|uniref:Rv0361 family membrane protein n=1 Tax=Nocardia sp. SYP-A9097 TaxID=2663237 RepID=UPI00129AE05D|nr:hypothetical protein [Nocardia sp. SYP-A9097]MRH91908.1 hypothetical protein [Nocardia sp. SYP-A9097]
MGGTPARAGAGEQYERPAARRTGVAVAVTAPTGHDRAMTDADDQHLRIDQSSTRSLLPFLVAAGVLVLVVVGIVVAALVSPVEKNVTDSDRLALASRKFLQSRSATGTLDDRVVCSGFDEQRSPLAPAKAGDGTAFDFVKLADPTLNGDKATAQVTFKTGDRESTSTWHFTHSGSLWLVCDS